LQVRLEFNLQRRGFLIPVLPTNMLDIRFIRENPDQVKDACRKKRVIVDIDKLIELDKKRRENLKELEKLRAERNTGTAKIAKNKTE